MIFMKLPLTWKRTKQMNGMTNEYVKKKNIEELVDLGVRYKIDNAVILVRKEVCDYTSLSFPEESKNRFYSFDLFFEIQKTSLRLFDFTSSNFERIYHTKKMVHYWTDFFTLNKADLQKKQFDSVITIVERIAEEFKKADLPLEVGYLRNVADFLEEAPEQMNS